MDFSAFHTSVGALGEVGRKRHLTRNRPERCVMARAQRRGLRFYRCFSVHKHGGWEAAEAAASLWLRQLLGRLPPASFAEAETRLSARNRSGVTGVFLRCSRHVLKSGRVAEYPGYVARWPGSRAGVKWSFSRCGGEEGAFLHACVARELATRDRLRVAWAVRSLAPERRSELLARMRALPA